MANKDRLNFDDACKELSCSQDELEQLVANGEIASFKDGDSIFFKSDVVAQFKKSRKTEPTIILADSDMEILEGMEEPAKPAPKAAQPVEMNLDDIVIEPRSAEGKAAMKAESATPSPEDTVLNLDGLLEDDGSEGTTPIPGAESSAKIDESSDITVEGNVSDDTLLDTDLLEIGEEEDSFKLDSTAAAEDATAEPTEATLLRGGGARPMQMKRKKSNPAWAIMLAATVIMLMIPLGVTLNNYFVSQQGETAAAPVTPEKGGKGGPKDEPIYKWVLDVNFASGVFEMIADWF